MASSVAQDDTSNPRCGTIINIDPEHIDHWLNPKPNSLDSFYQIVDDQQPPYYEFEFQVAA